jgi:pyruvate dehydrogenase E2 component (dihydrolipoamide acetyltransferase)
MGAMQEVFVPDIGDFKSVDVIEILVKPGDTVAPEQSLVTLESDKATMEIPSPSAGVVKEVRVKIGDKVSEGSPILVLEAGEAAKSASSAPATAAAPAAPAASAPAPAATAPAPAASAAAPAAAGGGTRRVEVPDIGDFKSVDVIEILVKPGDTVAVEQSLVTLESDKATMEVPAPAAGVVKEILLKVGDKVAQGSPILVLEEAGGAPARATAPAAQAPAPAAARRAEAAPAPAPAASRPPPVPAEPVAETGGAKPHASPSVRKFARELGVDLARVPGSGPKNRILQADVQAFVKGVMARGPVPAAAPAAGGGLAVLAWPQVDFAKFGPVETVQLPRIKKISGPNLHRNWVTIPHVTNHEDADITELEAFRMQLNKENAAGEGKGSPASGNSGVKLTMLAFLIKACVAALKKFPDFNSSLAADGASIVVKKYWHIGFAADTPGGLVVPVIKDADQKGIFDIAKETSELAKAARDGKLKPADMQGGTFSISSLGGIGGTYFTPIINAPEVAILGVCRSATRPVWDGKTFVPRLVLPLSLSWDHRVIDGASAARFNTHLAQLLADFRRVML